MIIKRLFFFSLLLLTGLYSKSGYGQWTAIKGADGFDANTIYFVDSTIIVYGSGGSYSRRMDSPTWETFQPIEFYTEIYPVSDKYLFTRWGSLYFSKDVGKTWESRYTPKGEFYDFAAVDSCLFILENDSIRRSYDLGNHWEAIKSFPGPGQLIACDNALFYNYGFANSVFHISLDMGITWQELPPLPVVNGAHKIQILNGIIYLLLNSGDFFYLDNLQGNWKSMKRNLLYISDFAVLDGNFYAASTSLFHFRSSDSTWIPEIINQDTTGFTFAVESYNGALYAGIQAEIYRYVPVSGWTTLHDGLNCQNFEKIVVINEKVWALSYYGTLYVSTDFGRNFEPTVWKHVNDIVVLGNEIFLFENSGFYVSTDFGNSWSQKTNKNLGSGISMNKNFVFTYDNFGIYRCSLLDYTTTKIVEWYMMYDDTKMTVMGNDVFYSYHRRWVGAFNDTIQFSVMRSTDNGDNFNKVLEITIPGQFGIGNIFSSFQNSIFYTANNFLISADKGDTWNKITLPDYTSVSDFILNNEAMLIWNRASSFLLCIPGIDSTWFDITGDFYNNKQFSYDNCFQISGKNILVNMGYNGICYRDDLLSGIEESKAERKLDISIFPNPAVNMAKASFELPQSQSSGLVSVFDLMGKPVVESISASFESGLNTLDIPVDNINPGIYIVKVTAGEFSGVAKLVLH